MIDERKIYASVNEPKLPTGLIVTWILVAVVFVIGGILLSNYFSYNNQEVALRQQAEAQRVKIESNYDAMWKIISQQAQISSQYKDAFKEIYPDLIAGRYSNGGGQFMQWIKECNPEFDTNMYKTLMQTVDVKRTEFSKDQQRMADIIREHSTLCQTYPSKWFISNTAPIEYTVISSTRTKTAVETGIDDDVNLF